MPFQHIIGQKHIINHLKRTIETNRVAHAQLFVGKQGVGTLAVALAYAELLLCQNDENCRLKVQKLQHPDLHFSFPTAINQKIKKHPVSKLFLEDWRSFIKDKPYD